MLLLKLESGSNISEGGNGGCASDVEVVFGYGWSVIVWLY